MSDRFVAVAAVAAEQHGVVGARQLDALGIHRRMRSDWVARGLLARDGPHSFVVAGAPPSWLQALWAAKVDLDGRGFVAGRSAARLHRLDGFESEAVELLVARRYRSVTTGPGCVVRSTSQSLSIADTVTIGGLRCLTAERLILEAPLFDFSGRELENAIDSAIRMRLVDEARLRTRVLERQCDASKGCRQLVAALVDTGGESCLERWFLAIVRRGGLPRPTMRRVWRDGSRTIARVDATFPGNLVVELEGHATHSTRRQRQHDEERRTALVLRGLRVITFTYADVRDRPEWVLARLREALAITA